MSTRPPNASRPGLPIGLVTIRGRCVGEENLTLPWVTPHTICTKRAALRRFVSWRRRLKRSAAELDESEVTEFMASASQLEPKHRCLVSVALLGFLEHLRRHEVITRCAPEAMGGDRPMTVLLLLGMGRVLGGPMSLHLSAELLAGWVELARFNIIQCLYSQRSSFQPKMAGQDVQLTSAGSPMMDGYLNYELSCHEQE